MSQSPFSRRLVLESPAAHADGAGGRNNDWVEVAVHWAAMTPLSARERSSGGGETTGVRNRAEIRFVSDEDPARPRSDQRFREGAKIYAIRGVAEADDRRERLVVWLEEGLAT